MKKKTSGKLTNIVLVLIFLAGLSLLLYPTVSDYWNSLHASRAVSPSRSTPWIRTGIRTCGSRRWTTTAPF